MNIRTASSTDREKIAQLHIASIRKLCAHHYTREQVRAWTSVLRPCIYDPALREKIFLVAENAHRDLLGLGILDIEKAELCALYIGPDATGKGIGSALLHALEKIAQQNGIARLTLYSTLNAKSFYLAAGYAEQGAAFHSLPDGSQLECIRMAKDLPKDTAPPSAIQTAASVLLAKA